MFMRRNFRTEADILADFKCCCTVPGYDQVLIILSSRANFDLFLRGLRPEQLVTIKSHDLPNPSELDQIRSLRTDSPLDRQQISDDKAIEYINSTIELLSELREASKYELTGYRK